MALFKAGARFGVNMDAIDLAIFFQGTTTLANSGRIYVDGRFGDRVALFGDFGFDGAGVLAGGSLNHIQENLSGFLHFDVSNFSLSATGIIGLAQGGDMDEALAIILNGNDSIIGASFDDVLHGYAGDDTIDGGGGYDVITGGAGNDVIVSGTNHGPGDSILRGEDGDDSIVGGIQFDDINGNAGRDTIHGREGDDWVVGGQGGDLLYGDAGRDQVYGNMGADTGFGGDGNDTLRGGQDNDVLYGEDGDDFVSGDRGNDILSGGAGADTFNTFVGAGTDYVSDFSAAEGDRVRIEGPASYTLSQSGADTVVNLGGGDMIVLVGVQLTTLPAGWIYIA